MGSGAAATIRGAQVSGININLPGYIGTSIFDESVVEQKEDDTHVSNTAWEHRDSRILHTYFEMCEKYDDLFKDLVHLDETKARDYLIGSGLASAGKNGPAILNLK